MGQGNRPGQITYSSISISTGNGRVNLHETGTRSPGTKFLMIIVEVSGRGGLETDLRKTLEPDLDNASEGKSEMEGRLRLKKPESSFFYAKK